MYDRLRTGAGRGHMTSAPKPDPSLDQVTIYRLDHLMFLLVGTIILTSLNMCVWTFIGAVIRFYGWFGDARGVYIIIFIGAMGFAATQLIVGILGIVVLFQRQRQQRQGRKLR